MQKLRYIPYIMPIGICMVGVGKSFKLKFNKLSDPSYTVHLLVAKK